MEINPLVSMNFFQSLLSYKIKDDIGCFEVPSSDNPRKDLLPSHLHKKSSNPNTLGYLDHYYDDYKPSIWCAYVHNHKELESSRTTIRRGQFLQACHSHPFFVALAVGGPVGTSGMVAECDSLVNLERLVYHTRLSPLSAYLL